jgi:hypothetical protein
MPGVIGLSASLSAAETAALDHAARTLNRLLAANADGAPQIIVWDAADHPSPPGAIRLVSLLLELERAPMDWAEHERAIRETVSAMASAADAPIFLLTIFRHVPLERDRPAAPLRLRLRRLNLLALELSRELGVNVIDIDRFIADTGGHTAQTDYRLEGERAASLAGFVMAQVLLMDALPDHVAPSIIDQIAQQLEAERPVFKDEDLDWPELVKVNWLEARPRNGFSNVALIYEDFDPKFVALQLRSLLQGKVTMRSALKAIQVSAGRHGVKATARRLWYGAAQLRKSTSF